MMSSFNWLEVWERKGAQETEDLSVLNGYEYTDISPEEVARRITKMLDIKKEDRVLEVGCGAGAVAEFLNCDYVGIDYSKSLVLKHIELLKHQVVWGQANDLIFKDKSFDIVFCFSVFQYFPNKEYARQTMKEMIRVAKKKICVSDLAMKSHRPEHMVYDYSDFEGWTITDGFHSSNGAIRFNASLDLRESR